MDTPGVIDRFVKVAAQRGPLLSNCPTSAGLVSVSVTRGHVFIGLFRARGFLKGPERAIHRQTECHTTVYLRARRGLGEFQ
jgi:hypothetical protein